MTQSLISAIARIQDLIGALSGIRTAPDYPPDQIGAWPAAICYLGDGEWHCEGASDYRWVGNIVLELHTPRKDLTRDMTTLLSYVHQVANEFMADPTLNSTVAQIAPPIRQERPALGMWGEVETLFIRWNVPVVVDYTIT